MPIHPAVSTATRCHAPVCTAGTHQELTVRVTTATPGGGAAHPPGQTEDGSLFLD